jgi:hypothetical protein
LWVKNPTFDSPAGGATPDFVFDEQGLGWPRDFNVSQGGSTSVTLPIRRLNGSNGNIAISAGQLPSGVTATFAPNPVPTTGPATNMTLTASRTAPVGSADIMTVTGNPASVSVAAGPRTGQVEFGVASPLTIPNFSFESSYNVVPCTPLIFNQVFVDKDPAVVTGDVTLQVLVSAGGVT